MLTDLRRAYSLLDPPTRRALPFLLGSFAGLAFLDALSIGLVFPLMLSVIAPSDANLPLLPSWLPFGTVVLEPLALAATIVGLFVIKNLLAAFLVHWQYRVLSRAEAAVGVRLFEGYLSASWRHVSQLNSSEMIRNASVSASHAFLSYIIPMITLMVEGLLVLAVLCVLMIVDARVAISAFALLAVAGVVYYGIVRRTLARVGEDFQKANLNLLTHLKQGIGAGREIRVLQRAAQFVAEVRDARALYAGAQTRRAFYTQLPRFYLETVLVLGVMVGAALALVDRSPQEVGAVMAVFGVAALRLMTSASRMLGALQQVRIGTAPMRIVAEDLARDMPEPSVQPVSDAQSCPESGLGLCGVSYAYVPNQPVLQDVTAHVPWGGSLGVVGPSGSGKSTLIDIVLGLLPTDHGSVCVDGVPITADLAAWRRRIGFVPQSIYLTDDSLRRNVAFGVPPEEIDDDAVRHALHLSQLDDLLARLPQGLETPLGDLGTSLSGGQRQRVGIARALYHNPDVLVLDEATSALDGETEAAVVSAIDALAGRKTVIVVAHRLSTVQSCDRLMVLEQGRVDAIGSYERLAQTNTVLKRMMKASG